MSGLLVNERKARWIATGTWSDSGIEPNRLATKQRVLSFNGNVSFRTGYSDTQIVAVNDLYIQWNDMYCSSNYSGCGCQGHCGQIANTNCNPNNSSVWGCICYHSVNWNTTGGAGCQNGSTFYGNHGNCSMNNCNYGTCGQNGYGGWCAFTYCNDYCPCAYGYSGTCTCNTHSGNSSWSCSCNTACRNCPSDQSNDCHCNSNV